MANIRWDGHSHKEIYDWMQSANPKASTEQSTYWDGLTKELEKIDGDLQKELGRINASWEGQAAEHTKDGLTPLAQWAGKAQTGSTVMKVSADLQASNISTAKHAVPKPVEVNTPEPGFMEKGAAVLSPIAALAVAKQSADHEQEEAKQAQAQ